MTDLRSPGPIEQAEFISPTYGRLSFDQVFTHVTQYMDEEPERTYNLIIGTDSLHGDDTTFVTAIVVHQVGHGGRYFYRRFNSRKIESLRQRIMFEASLSLELAQSMAEKFVLNGHSNIPIEIHVDIGPKGETRKTIKEVVGMVKGSGYTPVIKPDSFGASHIADKHSK